MNYLEAVEAAKQAYEEKPNLTREGKIEWVQALDHYKIFSNKQLTQITGMRPSTVTLYTHKSDGRGVD